MSNLRWGPCFAASTLLLLPLGLIACSEPGPEAAPAHAPLNWASAEPELGPLPLEITQRPARETRRGDPANRCPPPELQLLELGLHLLLPQGGSLRGRRIAPGLGLLGVLLLYPLVFIGTVTPYVEWHLGTAASRVAWHVVPALALWLALVVSPSSYGNQARRANQ